MKIQNPVVPQSTLSLSDWRGSISTFNGFTGTRPIQEIINATWEDVEQKIAPEKPAILDDKKHGQYFVPCALKNAPLVGNTLAVAIQCGDLTSGKMRSKQHVTEASMLVIDLDGLPEADFKAGLDKLGGDGLTYIAYTTHSHGRKDKLGMRARIVIPMDVPADTENYAHAWHGFDQRYWNGKAGKADSSGANLYQQQGVWACHPDRIEHAQRWPNSGGVASADALIAIGRAAFPSETLQAGSVVQSARVNRTLSPRNIAASGENSDYPPSDANKVADVCPQIGHFRDTKGAGQKEPDWFNCLGVVVHCENGDEYCQEWSRGHAGYDEHKTAEKMLYRRMTGPTTCAQFRKTNPAGCGDCTHTCKSPIMHGQAGWEEFEATETHATESGVPAATCQKVAVNAASIAMAKDAATPTPEGSTTIHPEIQRLNQQYALIEQDASIYRLDFRDFIDPSKFRLQHDNRKIDISDGGTTRTFGVGSGWLNSPHRRQHKMLVLRPGENQITADNCLNEWQGFHNDPAKGDVRPLLRLMVRTIPNRAPRRYVQQWMAHLIQHPGIKMFVSLAVWSHAQGAGKNLLFETLTSIIGSTHSTVIGQTELTGAFNGWANRRVLVIGDEVSGNDKRQENDKLKGLITGTAIHINEKYQPDREQPNLLNFIFLSNHHDALFLNDHDRRFFVWEIESGRLPEAHANSFVRWRDAGGLSALHYFLLNYPLCDFNPKAPAPMTTAKQQMANDNKSDLEAWIADMMASDVAEEFGCELASANEIGKRYADCTGHAIPSAKAVVGACKRNGAYSRPDQVRLEKGKKVRLLALTRVEFWRQQTEAAWAQEMEKAVVSF